MDETADESVTAQTVSDEQWEEARRIFDEQLQECGDDEGEVRPGVQGARLVG